MRGLKRRWETRGGEQQRHERREGEMTCIPNICEL
jgi:hypothetical protein